MLKTIYLLNINDYSPEITAITYPFIEDWAKKIGAEIYRITERKYPDYPTVYEKLQIYDIEKERKSDWVIYIDSDCLIYPDLPDVTEILPKDTVLQNGHDYSWVRFGADDYMRRDGRWIGTCNWFTVFSSMCLDLYQPLTDMTLDEAMARLTPTLKESEAGIEPSHLIDDFVLTRNLARFGLKYTTLPELFEKHKCTGNYLFHHYMIKDNEKVELLKNIKSSW